LVAAVIRAEFQFDPEPAPRPPADRNDRDVPAPDEQRTETAVPAPEGVELP
jgi:hypothetical protein